MSFKVQNSLESLLLEYLASTGLARQEILTRTRTYLDGLSDVEAKRQIGQLQGYNELIALQAVGVRRPLQDTFTYMVGVLRPAKA